MARFSELILGLVLTVTGVACSSSQAKPAAQTGVTGVSANATTLEIVETEYSITPPYTHLQPGEVIFEVSNTGSMTHEFVVLRTELAPAELPLANERAQEVGHVGGVGNIAPETSKTLTLNLSTGSYLLISNLPGDYQGGMRAQLDVY